MKTRTVISSLLAMGLFAGASLTSLRAQEDTSGSDGNVSDPAIVPTPGMVSQAAAETAALALVPGGKVVPGMTVLEDENGTIVWSVAITLNGTVTEVLVDATTGVATIAPPDGPDTGGGLGGNGGPDQQGDFQG